MNKILKTSYNFEKTKCESLLQVLNSAEIMASFSCKYRTAAEIETLDFIECIEILEENGFPYGGTEEVEDLRKTIIDLLSKQHESVSETDKGLNLDDSTDSETEEKCDEITVDEMELKLDENIVLAFDPKPAGSTASEMESSSKQNTDSEMVEKSEEHTISEMESSPDKNSDFDTEAEPEEHIVSEMEEKNDEKEVSAKEQKSDESIVCEMEPNLDDDTFSEMETDPVKPKAPFSVEESRELTRESLKKSERTHMADVSLSVSGPADVSPSVTGPANVSPSVSGPTDVSPSVSGPADVSPSVYGPADVSPSVYGPTDVSPSVSGPADVSPSASVIVDTSKTGAVPDNLSESVGGSDGIPKIVAGSDDMQKIVISPEKEMETVAGADVPNPALGLGAGSSSVQKGQVSATTSGDLANQQNPKEGDMEFVDKDFDPEGTEKMDDVSKFIKAVQEGNDTDLGAFKTLFQNIDFEFEHFPVNPLLIVSAFGSPKAVEYVQKLGSTAVNWNEHMEIKLGVFEGLLDNMNDRKATPLYVATFLKKQATVESLIKYSDEKNFVYCMNNIQLSNSMEGVYMAEVGEQLKREYSDLKPAVVPGHQKEMNGTWGRVFVVYSPDVVRASNHVKEGIGMVMLRNPYKVDHEARTVSYKKDKIPSEISKEDIERTKQAIESHGRELWCNHSNLNIISVCSLRSKQKGEILEKTLCVVLYCSTKGVVPLGEEEFPTKLHLGEGDSVDTDVREGYFEYGGYDTRPSTYPHKTLKMGCNIGKMTSQVQNGGGTLGPFVLYNGAISFLTCAHVLFNVNALQNNVDFTDNGFNRINVAQPAPGASFPTGAACGYVQRAIFNPSMKPSIDVAVVTISDSTRRPIKGRFASDYSYKYTNVGFDELPEYNNGSVVYDIKKFGTSNMVIKFGSETHLTKGSLVVHGTQVRPLSTVLGLPLSNKKFCMSNQYEVEGLKSSVSFFQPGDSGSAVFMLDRTSLHCIGMAIGHMSNGNAVVTPIGALLNALGTCSIAKFEVSPPQRTAGTIKKRYRKLNVDRLRLKSMHKK